MVGKGVGLVASAAAVCVAVSGEAAADGACQTLPVFDAGQRRGDLCPQDAVGLTPLDLSDAWLPGVFSETAAQPLPLRRYLVELARERLGRGAQFQAARRDRHFELFGISPALVVLRARLHDEGRHRCHDAVSDGALAAHPRTLGTGARGVEARAATRAVEAHLACEGLLDRRKVDGRFDRATAKALGVYQRRHMLSDHERVDVETRIALVTDSRELDFRALLRVLRERVVDATGLIEDGSASGQVGEVVGRLLDNGEVRAGLERAGRVPGAKETAPDLIAQATEAAARALGWTSPEAAAAALRAELPAAVLVPLPASPAYHRGHMDLRAEIDRGEVWLSPPVDARGRPVPRKARRRPTLTVYARHAGGEVALARWPTTIGGWKPQERRDGTVALTYKESRVGEAVWRDLLALPTWHPPSGIPVRRLLVRTREGWAPKRDMIGPGYRAAYGLIALVHHQVQGGTADAPMLVDYRIRTHGSPSYRSILRGESHGCHRLYNHLVVRLASFLLRHREHVRHGVAREAYVRKLSWEGQEIALESTARGYRYELTPPVPVTVLAGEVRGSRKAVMRPVPLASMAR